MDASTNCTVQTEEALSRIQAFSSGLALGFQIYVASLIKDPKLTANQICRLIETRLKEIQESQLEMTRIHSTQTELRFHEN